MRFSALILVLPLTFGCTSEKAETDTAATDSAPEPPDESDTDGSGDNGGSDTDDTGTTTPDDTGSETSTDTGTTAPDDTGSGTDTDTADAPESFAWAGEYPGTIRLVGTAPVCEGTLTIVVDDIGGFSGSGTCADESLGSFGEYSADFSGILSATGIASGGVALRSFTVDNTYALSGSIGESGLALAWFVDEISIDGVFASD